MTLVTHPNPVLRTLSVLVDHVGKNERRLLKQMLKSMRRWRGIGLAAPQVGLLERLIVAEVGGCTALWANPVILERRETAWMEEGCLSIPETYVDIARAVHIWIRALDVNGKKVECRLQGLLARVIQHEIDHLNGILIIDHRPSVLRTSAYTQGKVK